MGKKIIDKYEILDWVEYFEKTDGEVDIKSDLLLSNSKILYPGRFYMLEYIAKTKERFNARPIIISLGITKADPDSFLCIDLSVMPKKIRLQFIKMFFEIYRDEIWKNIEQFTSVEDADKQTYMKDFTYENVYKSFGSMLPIKNTIKRYKIENTKKIYSVPFSKVYKIVGDFCDENCYMNGKVADVQKEFLLKMQKK